MRYFDCASVARAAQISPEQLQQLCAMIREEFPRDDMMYALHVLRACTAIRDGRVQLEHALHPPAHA